MIGALLWMYAALAPANPPFWSSGAWSITESEHGCTAVASYGGDVLAFWSYDDTLNQMIVLVADPKLQSSEEGKSYKLELYFQKKRRFDSGWGTIDAKGAAFDVPGDKRAHGLTFILNGQDAISDFRDSDFFALMRGDIVVESLSLRGSLEAMAKLEECARLVARKRPSDPLRGAESK